jgi:type IV secretory pathway VirJ component
MLTTTTPPLLRWAMADAAVDATLSLVATMVGVPRETVEKIVAAGLPLMADAADGDPLVFKAMYAWSVKHVPEPTPASYAKLGKNAAARQAMVADFELVYGDHAEAIARAAGVAAGVTGALSRHVLAATMPTVVKAVGKANANANEMGFGRLLRILKAAPLSASSTEGDRDGISAPTLPLGRSPRDRATLMHPPGPVTPCGHVARSLDVSGASLHRAPLMTPAQARDTIDRLSSQTAPFRHYESSHMVPIKGNDHVLDADRYSAMERFWDPIMEDSAPNNPLGWKPNTAPAVSSLRGNGFGAAAPLGSMS